MKYLERWAVTRQAGFLMVFLTNAFRAFMLVLLVQVFYQIRIRDFNFHLGLPHILTALGISLLFWLVNEFLYRQQLKKQ